MEDQRSAIRSLSVRSSILHSQSSIFRRAFSFAEVMFAVVILGIGFIMVAAVFPVAIRQTQSSTEENTAANAARTAASAIMSLPLTLPNPYRATGLTTGAAAPATVPVFPPTIKNYWLGSGLGANPVPPGFSVVTPPAVVVPFIGTRGDLLYANIIQNTDPRYSYIAFYKRENNSSVAELIVIAVANRNRPVYDSTDLPNSSSQTVVTANLLAQSTATAQQTLTRIIPDSITPVGAPAGFTPAEGYTVALTTTPIVGPPPYPPAVRTFALGRPLNPPGSFEANPGDGITVAPSALSGLWGDISATVTVSIPYKDPRTKDTDPPGAAVTAALLNKVSTLQPTVAYVQSLTATTANPTGQITLSTLPQQYFGTNLTPAPNAVTGAFVIIADDCPYDSSGADVPGTTKDYSIPPNSAKYQVGRLNGRIFRLGSQVVQDASGVAQSGTFLLDPAFGMQPGIVDPSIPPSNPNAASTVYGPDSFPSPYMPTSSYGIYGNSPPGAPITARCYIIGAGKDPTTGKPAGTAQDLGAFATYFQVQ